MSSSIHIQLSVAVLCFGLAACHSSSQPSDASVHDAAVDTGGPRDAGRPCSATCQCRDDYQCVSGHCTFNPSQFTPDCPLHVYPDGSTGTLIGGPSCTCGGGSCEEDPYSRRGCCVAPDGHVADDVTEPICLM